MPASQTKPQLVFDGDCGICRYWVNYWQALTGESVTYRPYQEVHTQYPDITEKEFRQSIQFIDTQATRYSGAEAVYTLLQHRFPYNLLFWCYHHLPGYALCAELAYRFFARRRGLLRCLSYLFWGRQLQPARYDVISGLYLRLLGVIYLSAFVSLATQVTGLSGTNGILPVSDFLQRALTEHGLQAYVKIPTVFWLSSSDFSLLAACLLGSAMSLLLVFNRLVRTALLLNFLLYLSLVYAGQVFMQFQWDLLLLECGFLALFLSHGNWITTALYRWLMFRFMLLGGLVKLISGDASWDNLTALSYHFETQPLPTPLAWHAHHLPDSVLNGLTASTLIIELVLPFLLLAPRNIRMTVAWIFILFQAGILLTGNYNFFNLLTIFTCLFLFDDAAVAKLLPDRLCKRLTLPVSMRIPRPGLLTVTVLVLCLSLTQLWQILSREPLPVLSTLNRTLAPFRIVNQYGPFAVMTRVRHEIIVQGSNDGKHWKSYRFRHNPGDVMQAPGWVIPHQPRLDWQMWFAALSQPNQNPWFVLFLKRLLEDSRAVTAMLGDNPFSQAPPTYVRAVMYEYHFSDPQLRQQNGQWWTRSSRGLYIPPLRLADGRLQLVQ